MWRSCKHARLLLLVRAGYRIKRSHAGGTEKWRLEYAESCKQQFTARFFSDCPPLIVAFSQALMWLWANGCPVTWNTELDRTWVHEDFQSDHSGSEAMPTDWKSIAKDLDAYLLPPVAMTKRFVELLKFLSSRSLLNATATKVADMLLANDGLGEMANLDLPNPPKRSRHWLLGPDEEISSDPEMRPSFFLEVAAQLALRYGEDYDSMNASVLKDHPVDVLRYCGKPIGSEHLAAGIAIVQRVWPEIQQAAQHSLPLPILGLDKSEVRFVAKLAKLRESLAPLWKDESRAGVSIPVWTERFLFVPVRQVSRLLLNFFYICS